MVMMIDEKLERYAYEHSSSEPQYLSDLIHETSQKTKLSHMLTGRIEGRLLKLLVQISNAKLIVEVGTFTGYSALSMAEGLPEDGRIITCEINPLAREIAQAKIDASPYKNKIEIFFGPALESIKSIVGPIDLAFIDADKENYPEYYEILLSKCKVGGILILDNMLWSGTVLNPLDESSRAVAHTNKIISNDPRVENVLLTVRDGIQLVRKK